MTALENVNFNEAMTDAATFGYIKIVKLCKDRGASDFDKAMVYAAAS